LPTFTKNVILPNEVKLPSGNNRQVVIVMSKLALKGRRRGNAINAPSWIYASYMSDAEKGTFKCDRCGMKFNSESQMNAHKVSVHSIAGGELTKR
jgi:hypothetical protein